MTNSIIMLPLRHKNHWLEMRYLKEHPFQLDPDVFMPRKGILTRYGKKLLKEGERFYQCLKISDFKI